MDATEPVEDLRRPLKEMDSRFLRAPRPLTVDELDPDIWRGTREVAVTVAAAVEGDARVDCRCGAAAAEVEAFGVCPFSRTPNSLVTESFAEGDVPREGVVFALITTLALRPAFKVGELAADERLEIRGIFVGVSFVNAEGFNDDGGGGSLED